MIKENWKWVPTGQGRTKTITSKRSLYIFQGGLPNHHRRGHLCVLDFGLSDGYWIVRFVSHKGHATEFCHVSNLKEYKGLEDEH